MDSTRDRPSAALFGNRLLVTAPDPRWRNELADRLGREGCAVRPAETGAQALALLDEHDFDLVIVDVEIADVDELARHRPALIERPPILCVCPCDALPSLVPELGVEVEDYVTKPARIAEVLARAEVLLRGKRAGRAESALRHGDLQLDDVRFRARRGGRPLDLTPAEYRLLRHLMRNAGRVLSKEQLARHVWGEPRGANNVERLISRLRHKVGGALIHTRHGFGYWFGDGSATQ
ncbi:response regulator transcription factor [Symbioplanes lichenis]|uniref:response regulator transcription factor n=1 Tax=Symbioplanes lichenis TaxID=1629072 RepID=UPI0027393A53|nr:response regulator transcription factor [Actinoplanes lichenis]